MYKSVDVAVVGAGHAGLNAVKEIRKFTDNYVLINGDAEFIDPGTLVVGDHCIHARATVIATGAHPFVPGAWRRRFGEGILTVDDLFELEHLPRAVAVIGLDPIGLEITQALHRHGVRVTGIEQGPSICRIQDPAVHDEAVRILAREFPLWLGERAEIEREGEGFHVRAGSRETLVEKILLAMGRRPSLKGLHIERLGVPLNDLGVPEHDPRTLQVGQLAIFLAGDATGSFDDLQRAAEQGRIAGYNAASGNTRRIPPKTPMSIAFCDPSIASVGAQWSELNESERAVAQVRLGPVGRALIMGQRRGILRIYANRDSGALLGAAMIGPRCEHIAHLVAWAVDNRMTAEQALSMPFHHPVVEGVFQDALQKRYEGLFTTNYTLPQGKTRG